MGVMEDMTLACCVDSSLPLKKLIKVFLIEESIQKNQCSES